MNITYGQDVNRQASQPPAYQAPATLPPILRSTPVPIVIERRKATKANPFGSVKTIAWLFPGAVMFANDMRRPTEPPGANALIKVLASTDAEIVASYARGYDVAASGQNVRKPIWEVRQADENDEDAGKKRVKVGEEDPQPVDSITVAGVWRNGGGRIIAIAEGWWVDAAPQRFRIWLLEGDSLATGSSTEFMARVKEVADDLRRGERLL